MEMIHLLLMQHYLPRAIRRQNQYSTVFTLTVMIGKTGLVGGYFSFIKDIDKTIMMLVTRYYKAGENI